MPGVEPAHDDFESGKIMAKPPEPATKRSIGSDLEKVDAHVITAEEYKEIPELTDEDFARGDVYHDGKLIRRGKRKPD